MSDIQNVELGTCKVYFDGVDLGHTIGGVEVTYTPTYHETRVDQFAGVSERWLQEETLMATVPLAESTLANILNAVTHSTDETDHITMGSEAGKRSSTYAKQLRLHPIALIDSDESADVYIHRAHVTNEITLPYKNDGERVIEATFEGLVDEARTDGDYLGLIGDSLA